MSAAERPLFDVDKIAPTISAGERHGPFIRGFQNTARQNFIDEIERGAPYIADRVAELITGNTVTILGVDITKDDIPPHLLA